MGEIKIKCDLGNLSRPDGSVLFSEGETTVVAGVYGPVESRANKGLVEKAYIEAHYRPKSGLPGVKDRFHESILKNLCEAAVAVALFPRTSVVVVIQEMQDCGQLLSCGINATCLALLNSGIDMRCMFAASTSFLLTNDTLVLVPPTNPDEIKATFIFVFDSVEKRVLVSHTDGSFAISQYKDALNLCRAESTTMFDFFKTSLTK